MNNDIKEDSQDGATVESQKVKSQYRIYVEKKKISLVEELHFAAHFPHVLESSSVLDCVYMHYQSSSNL